ncbi:MAG TPA: 2-dehydropantoate 2-reductase [Candidatus Binataceae bacterium]|nr:2-dehydropantoate 2-reductase [Candidatus Binataceae bacterium]
MMKTKPILIAGAGALGSVMGGMLRAAGHQVALLGRPRHLDAIARRGLVVDGLFGRREAGGFECFGKPEELGGRRFSLILVTVKSYDTAEMAAHLPGLLAEGGVAISVQNGLGNFETLAHHLGSENVLAARVIFGAEIEQPGRVRVTVVAEPVLLGPAPDLNGAAAPALYERAGRIASMLEAAGIPTLPAGDIRPWLWAKLFYNAALNPLGALLKLHYGALGDDAELRRIMDAIVAEAFAVAQCSGLHLPYDSAADYLAIFYGRLLPDTFHHRPSMLVDLENRGRTEIAALNGRIVEMAAQLGLDAPVNRTITALIRARERSWRRGELEDQ